MKKILLAVFVILNTVSYSSYGDSSNSRSSNKAFVELNSGNAKNGGPAVVLTINQFDSVFFDVAQAVINGSTIEFPVYFRSDDVINALDFAFKYDQTHLEYDSIINLTSYIDPLAYYNPNDSTVRLTSYSFTQPYVNDTPLFIVRFTLLSGQLCSSDLDSVSALLNGDAASHIISDCTSGLFDSPSAININLFPNPADDILNFEVTEKATVEIVDISSKIVLSNMIAHEIGTHSINTSDIPNGVYLLKVSGADFITYQKFLIAR